jgi:hypothetical protein
MFRHRTRKIQLAVDTAPVDSRSICGLLAISLALLVFIGPACSSANAAVVLPFKVKASTAQSTYRHQRALLIRSLTIRGSALSQTQPQVTCDRKGCVHVGKAKTHGRRVSNRKYVFKNVNWLIRPGERAFTVALLPKTRSFLGRYIRFRIVDAKPMRLQEEAYGCVKTVAKKHTGRQKLSAVACPADSAVERDPIGSTSIFPNGGVFSTTPSIARDAGGNLYLGAINADGWFREAKFEASTGLWKSGLQLSGIVGQPAAVTTPDGSADFALTRQDGSVTVFTNAAGDISSLSPIASTGPAMSAGCPTLVMRGSEVDLVAASPTGAFNYWFLTGTTFNPIALNPAGSAAGCSAAVLRSNGEFDYTLADSTGALKFFYLPAGSMTSSPLNVDSAGAAAGCSAMVEQPNQQILIASIANSGALNFYTNTFAAPSRFIGCPVMTRDSLGNVRVAATMDDGSIWVYSTGYLFTSWRPVQVSGKQVGQGKLAMVDEPSSPVSRLVAVTSMGVLAYNVPK